MSWQRRVRGGGVLAALLVLGACGGGRSSTPAWRRDTLVDARRRRATVPPPVRRTAVPAPHPRHARRHRQRRVLAGPRRDARSPGAARPGVPLRAGLAGLHRHGDRPADAEGRPGHPDRLPQPARGAGVRPLDALHELQRRQRAGGHQPAHRPPGGHRPDAAPVQPLLHAGREDGGGDDRAVRHHPLRRRAHLPHRQGPQVPRLPRPEPCGLLGQRPVLRGDLRVLR